MDGAYEPSSVDELNKEDKNSLSFLNKETERKFNLADIKYTLLSGVSLLTLTACGGGGGGLFGAFGGGGAGLLGGMLLKGPVSGARVFQDLDGDGFTGAAPKNGGTAQFFISGSKKTGQTLTINRSSTDPDGDDGNYNYQWQLSSDGINWQDIGDNNSTYTLRTLDLGNKIRAQISKNLLKLDFYWD